MADSRYPDIIANLIEEKKHSPQVKIIYVSLGTLYEHHEEQVIAFFKKIFSIALKKPTFRFVISLSRKFWPLLGNVPANVFLLELVAQLNLLPQIDLFVTHAGLNSIKEAINVGVPLLCFPLSFDSDQPGNASRVQHHQLGVLGDMGRASEEEIAHKIDQLLTNPSYKQNTVAFAARCQHKYTEANFVNLFNQLYANYPAWM